MIRSLFLAALLQLAGIASAAEPTAASAPARPLVWIVDGAGDLKGCSNALSQTNASVGTPFELTIFPWSHGHRKLLLDQVDYNHAKEKGAEFAARLIESRRTDPGRRIVVVAHSAGCAVALCACGALPAGTIDRVVLLAPSVSSEYDVRPSLRAAREGIDVFCSEKDRIALGLVLRVVRTMDQLRSSAAAGRYGFKPKSMNALTLDESERLRHHYWSPDIAWTGHNGRHHGMHAPAFVSAYIFPLLAEHQLARLAPREPRGMP